MTDSFPPGAFPPRGRDFGLRRRGGGFARRLCRHVYNRLLGELGLAPLTREQERFVFVNTAESSLREVIPLEHVDWARKAKGQISPSEYLPLIKPNPGVRRFLAALKEMGIPAALNTNGGKRARTMLKAFGMEDLFRQIVTARDVKRPKPHPEGILKILAAWGMAREQVVFVGDSSLDRQAGPGGPGLGSGPTAPRPRRPTGT